ncbi:hypothetical protein V490_03394 [Pseudogymnoascus sp. VKM F-3557]|nr:hypothetical protein V490_03394 [Pseudogymnoascus sp. VKM F-3557]
MGRKTVLVIGASKGGIGDAIAKEFLRKGCRVFATARSIEKVEHLQQISIEVLTLDVTSSKSIDDATAEITRQTGGSLDILVNSSGLGCPLPLLDVDVNVSRKIFDVNVFGLLETTQRFAPLLIAARGTVVFISSVAGISPWAYHGMYNASKAAVNAIAYTLELELSPFDVKVITVMTGSVRTGYFDNQPPAILPKGSVYMPIKEIVDRHTSGAELPKRTPPDEYAKSVVSNAMSPKPSTRLWKGVNSTTIWFIATFFWHGALVLAFAPTSGVSILKNPKFLSIIMDHVQASAGYPPQPPPTFDALVDPSSVLYKSNKLCENLQQFVDKLVSTVTPANATFNNVLRQLLRHENEMQLTSNLITMTSLVSPNTALRNAAAEASNKISHCVIDCKTSNMDLFRLIDAVYQRQKDDETLDSESRKALVEERRSYVRKGIGLPDAPQTQNSSENSGSDSGSMMLGYIERRLQSIQSEFIKNLDERPHCIWLTPTELVGVPEDALAGLEAGTGKLEGKLKLDLNGMEARWMLTVASSPTTRQHIYLETKRVARENAPLFHEAIRLRHQSAQLLGYLSHLAFKVEVTMAKMPAAVMDLLDGVRDRVVRELGGDLEKLLQLKRADSAIHGQPDSDIILWSDIPYYSRLYEEQNYSIDQSQIAEYFPLYETVAKMLRLFGKLFGFEFMNITKHEISSAANILEQGLVWHPDVMLYSVWNDEQEGGEFAGYLYLDLHPRPGKCGGAQCRPLQLGFELEDGERHYPSTVLLTNFTKPASGKPSLLQHSDVVLLFHELGHGIHDLSGRCKYSRFHGAETVMDFSEAPSQMLENWCWDRGALKLLSGHYQTGEALPDDVIASLLRTRVVLSAVKLMPQLKMTLFDTAVHSEALLGQEIDVANIYRECDKFGGIKSVGDEFGYTTYRHLFSGNDGGMYSYLWSKVIAMDMFDAVFKKDPLDDKAGRRYRHMVLEKGGSQDEMETLVQFLGRRPTSEAFYKSLGLD